MTNFVRDNTSIAGPKVEWDGASSEASAPLMFCNWADYNSLRAAAMDLRGWVQTGLTPGTVANATLIIDSDGRITGVTAGTAGVPTSRTLTATTPIQIDGGTSADLSANRTLSILNFTTAIKGAVTASGASANVLRGDNTWSTLAQMTAALAVFTSALQGLVPASGGGTANFLRADGSWSAPTVTPSGFAAGTGADGAVVLDGTTTVLGMVPVGNVYTALRPYMFSAFTCNATVTFKTMGKPHVCRGVTTNNGVIEVNGGSASGVTAGAAPYPNTEQLPTGLVGGAVGNNGGNFATTSNHLLDVTAAPGGAGGATPTAGANGGPGHGGGGGGGGVGGAGGAGGALTVRLVATGDVRSYQCATTGRDLAAQPYGGSTPGGGGGVGIGSFQGGAGGASAGWLSWISGSFAGSGTWEAKGGNGGNGQDATAGLGGGGGGAGGGGGLVCLVALSGTAPTPVVTGGTGGTGGTGPVGGVAGQPGGNGGAGVAVLL